MENVSQLQPALIPQVHSSSSEASDKDADFLALRLLNKRARLRLSSAPPDLASLPGKASLFATANFKGWFAAAIREDSGISALILSPLADLRSALEAASAEDEQSFRPQRRVPINGAQPHIITFAFNDTRVLVGLVDGSIHVYASDQLLSGGDDLVQPIHVFTTSSAALLAIQPNPGDISELVAIMRDCTNNPGSLAVELLDVQKLVSSGGWMAGKSPCTMPTSISWSPKGKQLALGFQSGDIVTFSPGAMATPKFSIPHPPSASNMSVISVHWLSTSSFHTIYAPQGQLAPDVKQIHYNVFLDSKSNSVQDIRFSNPYLPFPGLRPPGDFMVCLRGWDPSKVLLFVGDGTSSDIGLIGSLVDDSEERWHNLALEETSTPSLPLDKDQNDTILLGMDVDLTSNESYHHSIASGEVLELPAHPIMYVFASDGTILGWHVLNVTGTPYPGMLAALNGSTSSLSMPSVPSGIVRESSSDMQTTPTISPTASTPAVATAITPLTAESIGRKTPSVVPSNVARDQIARDDDSRSPSPALVHPNVSSVFSSFTHGSSAGAFNNLQTAPSAFIKPASGIFGELPKNSPFFAPKPPESNPVFALSGTPGTPTSTPPKASFAQPTFGTSSMPGGAFKSAFPSVTMSKVQPAQATSSGAFSAFSSSGGFTAFSSGGNKSFSDLLRSAGEDKLPNSEQSQATPTKPIQVSPVSATSFFTPVIEPLKPPSVPSLEREREQPKAVEVRPSEVSVTLEEKAAETIPIQELSLESISSSTSSSFVKIWAEGEVDEGRAISEAQSQTGESDEGSDAPEEEESEVSEEEESETPEGEESEVHELEESEGGPYAAAKADAEQQEQVQFDPTGIPLPTTPVSTRSPSTTPKPEHPKISSPPQTPSPSGLPQVSPVHDVDTTSPASPVKDTPLVPVQMPVPTLKTLPQPASPFGLAPRPNNRPIRSSPLASTPLFLDGEVEHPPHVSNSAPSATVAQLSAPRTPFGQWTPPPPLRTQPTDPDSTYPRTPSVTLFPAPVGKPAASAPAPLVFTPPEKVATTTVPTTTPFAPLSTPPTGFPSFTSSTAMASTWGTPSKPAEAIPPTTKTAQTFFGGQPNLFGIKAGPLTGSPPFVSPIPSIVPSPSSTPPPKASKPEQGMHTECLVLLATLDEELENLKQLAIAASTKTMDLKKNSGINHQRADLGDSGKWAFGDIAEYGRVLADVQTDVKEIKLRRVSLRIAMKELGSNMLKINTRKEEIIRFNKAKTDAELAKFLKIRTLAPEYSETQSQLRKNIRAIKDRVQKLEDHLHASKKRINEFRTGRPGIRPPSLDTVNRTFRNIDIVTDQQKGAIFQLRHRMAKLEISGNTQDQSPVSSKRPLNVTSNVAITTAAALNAERSAQRLKKIMLSSRKQPLLNTTGTASTVPTSFETPLKGVEINPDVKTPSVFALPTTPMMSFPSSLPGWMPPSESGSHDMSASRNRGGVKHHHQKPIMLKKNASPAGPTQPSPFEWKPVEPIKPASSLPFALRPPGSI